MNVLDFCIILCNPEGSLNIGSVCRAMANMGFSNLRIIGKKENYDENKVNTMAIHATSIWRKAQFFNSIHEATKDCTLVAGTTRRRGKKRKNWLLTADEFAKNFTTENNGKIAIVFGNERTGLTDDELNECTIGVTIPTDDNFPSLNLSHAVQIICYELHKNLKNSTPKISPINLDRLDKLIQNITKNQKKIGFFSLTGRKDMENFWRGIFSRTFLTEGEAKYIENIFAKIAGLISKQKNECPENE
ncbi:MAG: RNA methyltransferase [Treponema sp.]|nr:RNA methyltransferase [Treponema sp.]